MFFKKILGYRNKEEVELSRVDEEKAKKLLDRIMEVIRKIRPDYSLNSAFSDMASVLAKAGKFNKAIKVARRIYYWGRPEALIYIASEMAKIDKEKAEDLLDKAIKDVRNVRRVENRGKAASLAASVAFNLAKIGKFNKAIDVAEGIWDAKRRLEALRDIAYEIVKTLVEPERKRKNI